MLTIRPGWTMTPPDASGEWEPYAYLVSEGDGWDLYWIRKDNEDPGEHGIGSEAHRISWPFGAKDIATDSDFERLGFRVET